MSTDNQNDLASFHHFVAGHLSSSLSPEEVLDLWRIEHPDPREYAETLAALKESIADMEAGDRGVPLEEFERDFRKRHGLGGGA